MSPQHDDTTMMSHEQTPLIDDEEIPVKRIIDPLQQHSRIKSNNNKNNLSYTNELSHMISLALPVVGTYFLEFLPGLVSIVLVGHLSEDAKEYMDATSMAVLFFNLTGLSIGIGLSTAMDTLCSQAYGAGKLHQMSIYLQTGILILSVVCLWVGILFASATSIFLVLGQPATISRLAGEAIWALFPGLPFLFLYELLRKVLQAQNIAVPMVVASAGANVVNAVAGYYLVYHTDCGWMGAMYARSLGNMACLLFFLPYLPSNPVFHKVQCQLSDAVRGIPTFLSLGLPGMLQLCFEWWAFESIYLLCGRLPEAEVAIGANAIIQYIAACMYMLYLGISNAGNVRIGNALGASDAKRARIAAQLTLGLCGSMAVLGASFLATCRHRLPSLLTEDKDLQTLATQLLLVAAVFQIPDSINAAVQGCLRGSGRQTIGAVLNFVAYYGLGIPCGCLLAFVCEFGALGFWMGMTVGLIVIALVGTNLVLVQSDWEQLAKDAEKRVVVGNQSSK